MIQKIFLCASLFFIQSAYAFNPMGAVSGATAGSGVGNNEVVDGVYLNPATISLFAQKSFAASYSKNHLNVHFTDNGKDALFPASLIYTSNDINGLKTRGYHLAFAYSFWGQLALGVDASMREISADFLPEKYNQTVVSTGLFYQNDGWGLGVVSKNKPLSNTTLTDDLDQTATVAAGVSWIYENFAKFKADVESAEDQKANKVIYMFGLETYINDWVVTRFGYRNDNVHSLNYFTAGLGFLGPQFGLNYAYQNEARSTTDPLHTIDLNIPF